MARVEVEGTAAYALAADLAGLAASGPIEPFAGPPPGGVRRAAEAEAERLAAFSGAGLELRWADPAAPGGAATG